MTLVSAIINRAYRKGNITPLGVSPSANQITEALELLNPIIISTIGFEASDELSDLNYGGEFDQSDCVSEWIPDNSRLILNLEAAASIDLDPLPYDGQRVAIVDAGSNLATYNLTLNGNGRNIEGAATLVLNTDDTTSQWMYRADTGNWVKIEELEAADQMPFPIEFDTFFIIMLAISLNPSYGQTLTPDTVAEIKRTRTILRGRYRDKGTFTPTDPGLVDPRERRYSSERAFNRGIPGIY